VNTLALRRAAGTLLVIVPLGFTICFMLLLQLFEYPDILRQPTGDVLAKFAAGGTPLVAVWYALTLAAVGFIPLTVLVHRVLAERPRPASASDSPPMRGDAPVLLWVATAFGLVAGLAQTLGFLRWPFLVPHLAQSYLAPGATEAQRAAAGMVFEAFHTYAGMAVGEHLGYLSTSVWTLLIAIVIIRTALLPRWLGLSGAVLALGIATGLVEPAGWELGGMINAYSYLVWALWLIAIGVTLLVRRAAPVVAELRAPLLPQSIAP
jgi:Domain of unknown function (DUF4386)